MVSRTRECVIRRLLVASPRATDLQIHVLLLNFECVCRAVWSSISRQTVFFKFRAVHSIHCHTHGSRSPSNTTLAAHWSIVSTLYFFFSVGSKRNYSSSHLRIYDHMKRFYLKSYSLFIAVTTSEWTKKRFFFLYFQCATKFSMNHPFIFEFFCFCFRINARIGKSIKLLNTRRQSHRPLASDHHWFESVIFFLETAKLSMDWALDFCENCAKSRT